MTLLLNVTKETENKIRIIAATINPRRGALNTTAEKAFKLLIKQNEMQSIEEYARTQFIGENNREPTEDELINEMNKVSH